MRKLLFGSAALLLRSAQLCHAATCTVAQIHEPSPAEAAYLHSEFDRAATLYREALTAKPNDPELTAALSRTLLRQQKVSEANDLLAPAIGGNPRSATLLTAAGFVQLRAGTPWIAAETATNALNFDPCNARAHLLKYKVLELNSMFAAAAAQLKTAHSLDPFDPDIRRVWNATLPLQDRIKDAEDFLNGANALDEDDQKHWRMHVDHLKKRALQPTKPCQLISKQTSTEIPFILLLYDATHVAGFGLDVKLNEKAGKLQIDTGAGGLTVSPGFAKRAGLERFSESAIAGVGSEGEKSAYTAIADSIQIGSLEFHNCTVEVVKSAAFSNQDGLIGMNVFSKMLVTLDYPMHKLVLGPLPSLPDQATAAPSAALATDEEDEAASPRDRYISPEMKSWAKVYRLGHGLIVPASLNDSAIKLFLLDTGAFSTVISPAAASEVTKVHRDYDTRIRGLSGEVEKVYTTGDLVFQFANVRQPTRGVFSFDTSNISKRIGLEISGLIGITTLDKLRVTIDYRDALVRFEYDPNRGYKN